jgi:hypothetical protein
MGGEQNEWYRAIPKSYCETIEKEAKALNLKGYGATYCACCVPGEPDLLKRAIQEMNNVGFEIEKIDDLPIGIIEKKVAP